MNRVNILILTHSLHIGGAEKHIFDLVSHIDRNRFNITVLCLFEPGEIGEKLSMRTKVYHHVMKNNYDIVGCGKLIRIMRNEKVDVVYILHTPVTIFWGIACAKLVGIKKSITRFTSTYPASRIKRRKIVNYLLLPFFNRIIAQSSSHKEYLINNEMADSRKITVINNGVDLESFNDSYDKPILRQEAGVPSGVSVVGIVVRPEKGHTVLLKAARKIIDSISDVCFFIVGDGNERKKLEKLAQEYSIQKNLLFLGMIKNIPQIISLFDVAVLASYPRVETFSNAVLEYMAASKPVVATNVGSIAEIVVDMKTGYIVPSDDPDALANAIIKLLINKDIANKMGSAGRKRVEKKFAIQMMINEYEELFMSVVK